MDRLRNIDFVPRTVILQRLQSVQVSLHPDQQLRRPDDIMRLRVIARHGDKISVKKNEPPGLRHWLGKRKSGQDFFSLLSQVVFNLVYEKLLRAKNVLPHYDVIAIIDGMTQLRQRHMKLIISKEEKRCFGGACEGGAGPGAKPICPCVF